jgi:hypothetical protein
MRCPVTKAAADAVEEAMAEGGIDKTANVW